MGKKKKNSGLKAKTISTRDYTGDINIYLEKLSLQENVKEVTERNKKARAL